MNISFDWGAVIVAAVGALVSVGVIKSDMRWLKEGFNRVEKSVNSAHDRIDALILRRHDERASDRERV